MHTNIKIKTFIFHIILVYLATDDRERNDLIELEINRILSNLEDIPFILMGGFNGRLGFLGPQNGERVWNWMSSYNLILSNGDPNCTGVITWASRGRESAIDFVLTNNIMYRKFSNMYIDEEGIKFDLSDHMISVYFNLPLSKKASKAERKVIEYLKCRGDQKEIPSRIRE